MTKSTRTTLTDYKIGDTWKQADLSLSGFLPFEFYFRLFFLKQDWLRPVFQHFFKSCPLTGLGVTFGDSG